MSTTGQVSSYSTITYTMNSYQAVTTSAPVATMSTQSTQSSNAVTYSNTNVTTISTTYGVQGTTQPPTASVVYTSSADNGMVIVKGTAVESTSVASVSNTYSTSPAPTAGYVVFQDSGGADSVVAYNVTTPGVVVPEQSIVTPGEVTNTKPTTTPAVTPPNVPNPNGIKTPAPTAPSNPGLSPSGGISGGTPVPTPNNPQGVTTPVPTYPTSGITTPAATRMEYTNSSNVVNTPAVTVPENESDIVTWLKNIDIHTALDVLGFIPVVGDAADLVNAGIYLLEGDITNALISGAGMVMDGATALRTAGAVAGGVAAIGGTAYVVGKTVTKEMVQEGAEKAAKETLENAAEKVVKNSADKVDDVVEEVIEGGTSTSKPNQVHHYATDKSKTYTQAFKDITDKYGLDLDADWNKDLLPHQGRHPNAYHDFVLDEMRNIDNIANGNKDIFLELYESEIKSIVRDNPDMLYSNYWKGIKE